MTTLAPLVVRLRRSSLRMKLMALGAAVTVGVAGVDTAVLDFHNEYFVGLRTDGALYRFFGRNHFGGTVDLGIYDFAGAPDEAAWSAWLEGLYVKP